MGKLGISIYPERSTYEKDKAYLDLAHQYGFKRVFTSLLQITEDKEKVLADFKKGRRLCECLKYGSNGGY